MKPSQHHRRDGAAAEEQQAGEHGPGEQVERPALQLQPFEGDGAQADRGVDRHRGDEQAVEQAPPQAALGPAEDFAGAQPVLHRDDHRRDMADDQRREDHRADPLQHVEADVGHRVTRRRAARPGPPRASARRSPRSGSARSGTARRSSGGNGSWRSRCRPRRPGAARPARRRGHR